MVMIAIHTLSSRFCDGGSMAAQWRLNGGSLAHEVVDGELRE